MNLHTGSTLNFKITPNSSQNKILGKFLDEKNQEYFKASIKAIPEDGKANAKLIKFLSKLLKIPKSKIEIIRGESSRMKMVKFESDFKINLLDT